MARHTWACSRQHGGQLPPTETAQQAAAVAAAAAALGVSAFRRRRVVVLGGEKALRHLVELFVAHDLEVEAVRRVHHAGYVRLLDWLVVAGCRFISGGAKNNEAQREQEQREGEATGYHQKIRGGMHIHILLTCISDTIGMASDSTDRAEIFCQSDTSAAGAGRHHQKRPAYVEVRVQTKVVTALLLWVCRFFSILFRVDRSQTSSFLFYIFSGGEDFATIVLV